MTYRIPFNKPCIVGRELAYVRETIDNGHASGNGPFTKRAQSLMEERFGARRTLLTTSCTAALEMAALLCDLKPGDEVILPSYTFVSTANAIVLRGATPVFVDIRADTLNIDEQLIEAAITPRTRAIFPVHYAGIACDMDEIALIAARHNLSVVEDAAQGVFAKYKEQWLGTIGELGCYSFHETKNFSCGEGGALVINNELFESRAEILREKGTNRSQFLRGQVDKYTWVDIGSSYVPSDMLAAFLLGQLENMERITEKRFLIYKSYAEILEPLAGEGLIRLPVIPQNCTPNYHMFYIVTSNIDERSALISHLEKAGILAVFHYVPLHSSPYGQSIGGRYQQLPVTEEMSERVLRLPFYYDMSEADVASVGEAILSFYQLRAKAR
jgi:dTDP-4-amino-4,6-dideoxygalactose transaminase